MPRSPVSFEVNMLSKNKMLFASVAFLLSICSTNSGTWAAEKVRPNIVFVLSDDQAWNDYGFMGHPHIETPNLDRIAQAGLLFTRGYNPCSLCRPSLASIITGLYPRQHNVSGNDPLPLQKFANGRKRYADPAYMEQRQAIVNHFETLTTLPERIHDLGYTAIQTGKWWEGNYRTGGFDFGMTHGDMNHGGRHGDIGLKIGREGLSQIDDFLNESKKPFFLWYAPMMPHQPHDPPARLLEKYQQLTSEPNIAKYWAMCEWFDETIGDLQKSLARHGATDNTLIVFIADNGWVTDPIRDTFDDRSKRSPYEGGIRSPIILHWPEKIKAERNDTDLACSVDLVPTVLALLDIAPDENLPGINLLDQQAPSLRKSLIGQIYEHDIVDLQQPNASLLSTWIIDDWWKLIEFSSKNPLSKNGEVNLYNLREDPTEQNDLSQQFPDVVVRLREKLKINQ